MKDRRVMFLHFLRVVSISQDSPNSRINYTSFSVASHLKLDLN